MPPVCGSALATSASVSAPQSAKMPPITQTESIGMGPGSLSAMPAGERKMPEPMVEPITTAMAVHSPMRRWSVGSTVNTGDVIALVYQEELPRASGNLLKCRLTGAILQCWPLPRLRLLTLPMTAFWIAATLVIVAQVMILRSTVRALRSPSALAGRGIEWAYAIVPAIALALVLVATWQAAQRRDVPVHVTTEARA